MSIAPRTLARWNSTPRGAASAQTVAQHALGFGVRDEGNDVLPVGAGGCLLRRSFRDRDIGRHYWRLAIRRRPHTGTSTPWIARSPEQVLHQKWISLLSEAPRNSLTVGPSVRDPPPCSAEDTSPPQVIPLPGRGEGAMFSGPALAAGTPGACAKATTERERWPSLAPTTTRSASAGVTSRVTVRTACVSGLSDVAPWIN